MNTTIEEIRRRNLLLLIEEYNSPDTGRGGQAELARQIGVQSSYISQIINQCRKTNNTICICGSALARRIETACDKPTGWMDVDHNDAGENELFDLIGQMDDKMQEVLLNFARQIVKVKK